MNCRAALSKGVDRAEGSRTMTLPGGGQEAVAAQGKELIPGIPDAITLNRISTKLPWRDIHMLAFVSRCWLHAIRSRQVYEARVRSNSTELLILSNESPAENLHSISLHTVSDNGTSRYRLPPITSTCFDDDVVPASGRSVTLDGKIYIFGGRDCKVHVLDVAGHGQWKQCPSTLKPREEFGCGVMEGKIYIFGGAVSHESTAERELYNPKDNTWSPVRSIVSLRCGHHVGRIRDQYLVGVNKFFHNDSGRGRDVWVNGERWKVFNPYRSVRAETQYHVKDADLLEVYDPTKHQWRVVERVGRLKEKLFVAMGKLYSMTPLNIYAYDFHKNSWVHLHSFSLAKIGPVDDTVELWPVGILTLDHELLAVVDWPGANSSSLIQSRGLGSQNEELLWQNAEFSIPYRYSGKLTAHFVKTIRL